MHTRVALCLLVIVSSALTLPARTFYVAAGANGSGSSSGSPMSMAALKDSLVRVSGGDAILLRCGDTLRDTLNLGAMPDPSTDVTIGSYGTGPRPILTGAKRITGWSVHQGNVYRATFTEPITHLIVGGKLQTIARFPNRGYDSITSASGTTSFTGYRLSQATAEWNGASAHFRIQNDVIDRGVVGSFSGATATLSSGPGYQIRTGNGYYLDGRRAMLDTAGEWAQESGTVYFMPPPGVSMSDASIEGMVMQCGIRAAYRNHVVVRDLSFRSYAIAGAVFNPGADYQIRNCEFRTMGRDGVNIWGQNATPVNVVIDSCLFIDILNNAIKGDNSSRAVTITNNTLKRIGMVPGYEVPTMVAGQGMSINLADSRIEGNTLDSIGYGGINAIGSNNVLARNIIGNTGMSKNDCGPFQTWGGGSTGWQIVENLCYNSWGNHDGMANAGGSSPKMSEGIYFDAYTANNAIRGNTVWNALDGIFIQASQNFDVRDNTVYNCPWNQLFINELPDGMGQAHDPTWRSSCTNITMKNNVFYSVRPSQTCVRVSSDRADSPLNFGTYDSNYVFNPYSELVITRSIQPQSGNRIDSLLTLSQWQERTGQDQHSRTNWFRWDPQVALTSGANLVTNGSFDASVTGWGTWKSGDRATWESAGRLDGGSLKYENISESEGDLSGNTFPVDSLKQYVLKFSCVANRAGQTKVLLWKMAPGMGWLTEERPFVFDTVRNDYQWVFRPLGNATEAKVSVRMASGNTVWFDNISVHQVSTVSDDPYLMRSRLFVNDTRSDKAFSLGDTAYRALDGTQVSGSITLAPYRSRILVYLGDTPTREVAGTVLASSAALTSVIRAIRGGMLVSSPRTGPFSVRVCDLGGRTVFRRTSTGTAGASAVEIALPPGTYAVSVREPGGSRSARVVVR